MATERQLQDAFIRGVQSIRDGVRMAALRDAIARSDYAAILAAIDVDDAAFDNFRRLMVETYAEGGISEVTGMPSRYRMRWNSASPRAEEFARTFVGQQITLITDDMRQTIRNYVGDSLAYGRSTREMALDIAGRIDATGKRRGGVVGLNQPQGRWVANMRRKLTEDPDAVLRDYSKRDKRFDKVILAAAEKGVPLSKAQIDRIVGRYSDNLLLSRGLMIARTERSAALNLGRQEAWRQAADKAGLPYSAIRKEWRHSHRQMEPRIAHVALNGTVTAGLDGLFNVNGHLALHPHDTTLPAEEVINCECQVRYYIPRMRRNG